MKIVKNEMLKNLEHKKKRYLFVLLVFLFFIFLNKSFPAEIIKSEDCSIGRCEFGMVDFPKGNRLIEAQTDNSAKFKELEKPETTFGQIFKAKSSTISGVELDFDVVKQHNNGGSQYSLEIKEIDVTPANSKEFDGVNKFKIENGSLAKLRFQIDDLDKYRQENGKYYFPLESELEAGEYYFLGIDNEKMRVDRFNHLRLKGTFDSEAYSEGMLASRCDGETNIIEGDLYFKIFE